MKALRSLILGTACLALSTLAVSHAHAQVVTYENPAAYEAASTGNVTYTFPVADFSGTSYTDGPLTFAEASLTIYNDGLFGDGLPYLEGARDGLETVTLGGATALSFNLGDEGYDSTFAISVNGAPVTVVEISDLDEPFSTSFLGLTDTVPITSVTFASAPFTVIPIDTTTFQVGTALPEPSTWALVGVGAVAAGILALRHRRARARVVLL